VVLDMSHSLPQGFVTYGRKVEADLAAKDSAGGHCQPSSATGLWQVSELPVMASTL
jgi:hypothetical protein